MKLNEITEPNQSELAKLIDDKTTDEIIKITKHWEGKRTGMSDQQLLDAVTNDMEQLEYSPNKVRLLAPKIVSLIKDGGI